MNMTDPKKPLPVEGSGSTSNTPFLWPTRVYPPICISIGSAIFAWLTNVTSRQTDTQTDHATPSVAIGLVTAVDTYNFDRGFSESVTSSNLKRSISMITVML